MTIKEYVNCKNEEYKRDFEEHIYENVFSELVTQLESKPRGNEIWTDGEEILCKEEWQAEMLADILDRVSGERQSITGYYDNSEEDEYAGYYYVTYD